MKKRKLLIIAPAYYPSRGGVERHIRETARELVKLGWQPEVLVRYDINLPARQTIDGVEVWRLPKRDTYPSLRLWTARHGNVLRDAVAVHSHDYYPRALRLLLPAGIPWVHTFHGYEGYPLDEAAIASRQKLRGEVRWCACVGDFIAKWYGTPCDYVTYGAVKAADFLPTKATKPKWDYVFIGRLESDTGFEHYLRAFAKLTNEHKNRTMAVVGDGSQMAWAKKFVQENKLAVQFFGAVANTAPYLHTSRVVFVSGYLGILEAALAKKPIVAYFGNPLKKDYLQMHPMAQYMYIAGSTAQIAQAAEQAWQPDAKHLTAMRAWAKRQTWSAIAHEYAQHYLG